MTCLSNHTDLETVMSRNCFPSLDFFPLGDPSLLLFLLIIFCRYNRGQALYLSCMQFHVRGLTEFSQRPWSLSIVIIFILYVKKLTLKEVK